VEAVSVGLDIGSSAVRAAEIHVGKDGRRGLRHYAQVGLPAGYVVDGEINNPVGVAAALRRLWAEGGFSTTEVILGVSGPRVFVRQADVPAMPLEDLRSSLKFDAQELVPIQMDDATFDFSLLQEPTTDGGGKSTQRILLVAAHRELLRNYSVTLDQAGLKAKVMDAAPLALMRAVPQVTEDETGRVEVIVSLGAELTTIAVRENGVPRFIRTLTLGGAKLTERVANTLHVEMAVAERLKRGPAVSDHPIYSQTRRAVGAEVRDLAEEIRATVDFFLSQAGEAEVERILVTGGAVMTEGLAASVGGDLPAPVLRVDPLAHLDTTQMEFDGPTMDRVAASSAIALWPVDGPLIRLSLLPEEVLLARRARRTGIVAGTALCSLVALLGVAGAGEVLMARSAEHKASEAKAQVASLGAQVATLQAKTSVHNKVAAHEQMVTSALSGDVDWVRVLGQLATVMPPSLSLTGFEGSRASSTSATSSSAGAAGAVGAVTFDVTGTGGLPAVSAWLDGLAADPDVTNVWLGGISVKSNGGQVLFTSTANLAPASHSTRDRSVGR
jgi:type IV pilus assembly protein PilM